MGAEKRDVELSMREGRMGGALCFHGTRVPVRRAEEIARELGIEEAVKAYPHIDREWMEAGLRLYRQHFHTKPVPRTPPDSESES